MNLADRETLKKLLARHGLKADKSLGQHFLVAPTVVEAIFAAAEAPRGVLEIGPGPGVLTAFFSLRVEKTIALEIDARMRAVLVDSSPAAEVRGLDALKADLGEILRELPSPRAVVSNLPYYITGPLLGKIAEVSGDWDVAVLMMQREVGERILAPAGDSARGSLSVFVQSEFEVERVVRVPAGSFEPPPKVESVVLKLRPRPSGLPSSFFEWVRQGFTQPRKTLANNLRPADIGPALQTVGLSPTVRPHELSLEQWKALFAAVG